MKKLIPLLLLLFLLPSSSRAQTQGCSVSGSDTTGDVQSFAFCQFLMINGRNLGGWIAVNRVGDQSNSETQCYDPGNVFIQNGLLTIIVRAEVKTCHYWPNQVGSASVTQNFNSGFVQWSTFSFTFGEVQIRMKGPSNPPNGGWPTVFLLGANCLFTSKVTADNGTFAGTTCNWPNTGSEEMDIFEQNGGATTNVLCNSFLNAGFTHSGSYTTSDTSAAFHIYGFRWISGSTKWFVDGVEQTGCANTTSVPTTPMFLQMNIAMQSTATSTGLPATMQVDWVRVCQPSPCSGNGGNTIFFDDFVTPIQASLLRPLSRAARLAGSNLPPSVVGPAPAIFAMKKREGTLEKN